MAASRHGPRSMAMTCSPASASSLATIEPVQPSPTITTSLAGRRSVIASRSALLHGPLRPAGDADRWQGVTLVVAAHPVAIVVARTGKSDHLPRAHVAVAAVDRICKEALLDVLDQLLEESLAIDALERERSRFQPTENAVLLLRRQFGKRSAAFAHAAVAVECRQAASIECLGPLRGLRPLLLAALDERPLEVLSLAMSVRSGELTVDENGTAGLLAARRLGVGRDDPVCEGFGRSAFGGSEESPRPGMHSLRGGFNAGLPRQ